jgi:hypothetical protein
MAGSVITGWWAVGAYDLDGATIWQFVQDHRLVLTEAV